jgi:hypothetical protein
MARLHVNFFADAPDLSVDTMIQRVLAWPPLPETQTA